MSSPTATPLASGVVSGTSPAAAATATSSASAMEPLPEDGTLEVEDDADSSFGSSLNSDTTSISSSIYRGIIENGRRYQTLREGEYWGPSDDKQWDAMNLGHVVHLTMDCQEKNPLFRSPIGDNPQSILDIGTGDANWAIDVADRYNSAVVTGVDLYPPPETWVPPNCVLEVDDIMKPWMFNQKFDLIHIRWMLGSFTANGWKGLYKQAYDNLQPGGWIEQLEPGLDNFSDDGSLPLDSKLSSWGEMFYATERKSGRPMDTYRTMKDSIAAAGFINIKEKTYKMPIGPWPKHPIYKEAGRLNLEQLKTGMEGYAMMLLTKFAEPEPWSPEQVHVFLAEMRKEMDNINYHTYSFTKRVWAQKPFDAKKTVA